RSRRCRRRRWLRGGGVRRRAWQHAGRGAPPRPARRAVMEPRTEVEATRRATVRERVRVEPCRGVEWTGGEDVVGRGVLVAQVGFERALAAAICSAAAEPRRGGGHVGR